MCWLNSKFTNYKISQTFYHGHNTADFNTLNKNGVYVCTGACINAPTADGYMLFVFGNNGTYFGQLAYKISNTNTALYFRDCVNGVWGEWGYILPVYS